LRCIYFSEEPKGGLFGISDPISGSRPLSPQKFGSKSEPLCRAGIVSRRRQLSTPHVLTQAPHWAAATANIAAAVFAIVVAVVPILLLLLLLRHPCSQAFDRVLNLASQRN
jgi:hypothetical protein